MSICFKGLFFLSYERNNSVTMGRGIKVLLLHVNVGGEDGRIGDFKLNQVSVYCLQNVTWTFPLR